MSERNIVFPKGHITVPHEEGKLLLNGGKFTPNDDGTYSGLFNVVGDDSVYYGEKIRNVGTGLWKSE